ncbi:glycoside hydrolase family 65 protein [Streptomyces alkaliphilus]|uniref:Glycoside hydrolase family 65 protein n=1 Tax=Streptomyces alkaliphilus TaxID=1472722 RepID=A0A7W3TAT3_9ACTN|nr:glycoside hydrolase family 65 protein [Streptomyces alkaliphilus]MBB0243332.1 glycoside hydrolase family 65 protein [Streptomyces alkaliphilus]
MTGRPDDEWLLRYEGYDPADEPLREALCTVGNGYLATRGAPPEARPGGAHYPGTYVAGVYNRLASRVAGRTVENECLVNLPHWPAVTFRIDDGPWFDIDTVHLLEHHQTLDLRRAVLTRHLRYRDDRNRVTTVTQRRLVHMRHHHLCFQEVVITPENWSGRLRFRSELDGRVRNTLVERYRDLADTHLEPVGTSGPAPDCVLLEMRTNRSAIPLAMAARTALVQGSEPIPATIRLRSAPDRIALDLTAEATPGRPVTLEKTVTVVTGRDHAISSPADEALRGLAGDRHLDDLLADHEQAWRHLWERFRITVEGHPDTRRIVLLHLLHLLQTISPHSADLDVGVPARGLHGEAYRGHVFWDELLVFPILNLRLPDLTRALLRYRHRRLDEARAAARRAGHIGAMYPWQSGSDGREESQQFHLNPRSGRWLPDTSARQHHIGLAIAHNVWQYHQVTGDREFLIHHGAEMLLEIARFWGDLAVLDPDHDRYVIRGVMGPDEFHTGYPGAESGGIDNNAYTNVMAVRALSWAMEAYAALPARERGELSERLRLDPTERARWKDITHRMFIPFHEGVISQFEGYGELAELDWEAYRSRYGDIHRLERILEAEGDTVNRYRASKQADALMLFHLLTADELLPLMARLGYPLDPDTIPRTIDHYLARTSHGSTLSAVVHAWVLARAHRERAVDFFFRALESDIVDIQGGTTAEGVHLGAMAGSVDLLQRCFSGLETRGGHLALNPFWPEALGTLEINLRYREHFLRLRINGDRVEVGSTDGSHQPVRVICRGQTAELRPGATVRFPL